MSDSKSGAVPASRPQPAHALPGGDAAADRGERGRLPLRAVARTRRAAAAAGAGGGAIPYEIVNWVDIAPARPAAAARIDLHVDVPARRLDAPHRQHVVPLDLRRQRRGARWARSATSSSTSWSGRVGALAQCFSLPSSTAPMIGASGAIAGVLGGYVMLFPRARGRRRSSRSRSCGTCVDVPAWIFLGHLVPRAVPDSEQLGRGVDGARRRLPGGPGRGAPAGAHAPAVADRGARRRVPAAAPRRRSTLVAIACLTATARRARSRPEFRAA